jgi:hypothetical protein
MDDATIRDLIIITYGILGIVLLVSGAVLAFLLYGKVAPILDDVNSIMDKVKTLSTYASKEIVEPLIALSVAIQSVAEGLRQLRRIFSGKGSDR